MSKLTSREKDILTPCEDGYEVHIPGSGIGYVFPDAFGGWRPYSEYGSVMNAGHPALSTPIQAAFWKDND